MTIPAFFLFVYGTLRKDYIHGSFPKMLNPPLVIDYTGFYGYGRFNGKLFDTGHYPGCVPTAEESGQVVGELYRLPPGNAEAILHDLDLYEGSVVQPGARAEFERSVQPVRVAHHTVPAWIYLYTYSTDSLPQISGGDYVRYLATRHRTG